MPVGYTGSLWVTGSVYVNGLELNSLSASYAVTSSYGPNDIVSASNGLTRTGSSVELGGNLYRNTFVTGTLDGTIDPFFPVGTGLTTTLAGFRNAIQVIERDSLGRIYIASNINHYYYNGIYSPSITRLFPDGTIDTSFNTGDGFKSGSSTLFGILPNGLKIEPGTDKIYVAGRFDYYSGSSVGRGIIRLNTDGTIDTTFNPGSGLSGNFQVNDRPRALGVELDLNGKIYVYGNFTTYSGSSVGPCIVRLNTDGTIDTGFNNDVGNLLPGYLGTSILYSKLEPKTNKLYVSGWITSYSGSSVSGLVKVNPDGTVDNTFISYPGLGPSRQANGTFNPTGYFTTIKNQIAIDKNLNAYLIGGFLSWNGTSSNGIIKINSSGSVDTSFNYGLGLQQPGLANNYDPVGINTLPYLDRYDRLVLLSGVGSVRLYSGSIVSGSVRIFSNGTIDPTFVTGSIRISGSSGNPFYGTYLESYDQRFLYIGSNANEQVRGKSFPSQSGVFILNIADPELSFTKTQLAYDTDYSQFYTSRSLVDKGYVDTRLTGSFYVTGGLQLTGSLSATDFVSFTTYDPLPSISVPTGSIASSGSGVDNKAYYWNGDTWTALF